MSSLTVNMDGLIDYVKDNSGLTDVSGIVIYDVSNNTGNSWNIIDSNDVDVYSKGDISDTSYTNAYFLPYSGFIGIELNYTSVSPIDHIGFYVIPAAAMSYFTGPRINITSVASYINTNTTYYANEVFMATQNKTNITSFTLTIPPSPIVYTTATLPILSSYTPEEIKTAFNTRDCESRVINTAVEQSIAYETKLYLNTNGALPQFKSYNDYIAYKKAINLQNTLLSRYTPQ